MTPYPGQQIDPHEKLVGSIYDHRGYPCKQVLFALITLDGTKMDVN